MSAFLKIEQALINSVDNLGLSYPVEYPNCELKQKDKKDLWLKVSNLSAASNVVTLGSNGEDNNPGIFQIDINVDRFKGQKEMLEVADTIATFYTAGKALQYGGVSVKVTSASLSPLRYVDGYARRSISVNYYSRTTRA